VIHLFLSAVETVCGLRALARKDIVEFVLLNILAEQLDDLIKPVVVKGGSEPHANKYEV